MPRRGSGQPSSGLTFFGMVGATMAALKLKEHWDEYRKVPTEEGTGPVALPISPVDEEAISMLDTQIPDARRSRKKADCCVCCGMRCGLFWKAFGIVCAFLVGWQLIKLLIWIVTPSPTGLEGMPEFSKSLGCQNAPYLFNGAEVSYTIPVGINADDHTLDIIGGAIGTIVFAQGTADATDIKYTLTLRTDNAALFEQVAVTYPATADVEEGAAKSALQLATPLVGAGACMRYDMTVYLPPALRDLRVHARGAAQVKFDAESNFDMDALTVIVQSLDERSMLLPHRGVHAGTLHLGVSRGWLVGDVAVEEEASLSTDLGDAVMNVHVFPAPSGANPPATATFETATGAGRADVFYVNHPGHPHRPIMNTHRSVRGGDLYLTYKQAEFNGTVELAAKSSTSMGMHGVGNRMSQELPWVGSQDGSDRIIASSPNGWIGLYF
ncbi:hypothetical protein WOLCODRAFT_121983 [Wolfiporia cocos MD-104 SS10]|uniref:Uncharacterized protein n=1 Tax=Wolfiporia cocos (strain MD-104) TaxID=742152 RepID=A0A2H3JX45_WOLCO|nr:hypothetical protein WOLCODRAFT_121983 [Wolfiporia cocos MD-104 SS10]